MALKVVEMKTQLIICALGLRLARTQDFVRDEETGTE